MNADPVSIIEHTKRDFRFLIMQLLDCGVPPREILNCFEEILDEEGTKYSYLEAIAAATKDFLSKVYPDVADMYDDTSLMLFAEGDVLPQVIMRVKKLREEKEKEEEEEIFFLPQGIQ